MAKPTSLPRWASVSPGTVRVEPSEGAKDTGWVTNETPTSTVMNWLQGVAYDWLSWIDSWTNVNASVVKRPSPTDPNQTIPTTSDTPVTFYDIEYDTSSYWDVGNPTRLTAPVNGKYRVSASVNWDATAGGFRTIKIVDNSGVILAAQTTRADVGTAEIYNCATATVELTAGEYVEIKVNQSAIGSADVVWARAMIELVGVA